MRFEPIRVLSLLNKACKVFCPLLVRFYFFIQIFICTINLFFTPVLCIAYVLMYIFIFTQLIKPTVELHFIKIRLIFQSQKFVIFGLILEE